MKTFFILGKLAFTILRKAIDLHGLLIASVCTNIFYFRLISIDRY